MSVEAIDRRFYPAFRDNWDDTLFRERILSRLTPESSVLDVGAGAGIVQQMNFRGLARRVCGVDLDERVLDNPNLDDARIASAERIPYADETFDLAFSDNVLEHLDDPVTVFREVCRVLRPGGTFLVKTPNRFHYVPLIAMLTPHKLHGWINQRRGRQTVDTFPTRYRANSKGKLARLARDAGLTLDSCERIEGRPEYLRMHVLTYLPGLAYERIVNSTDLLAMFRVLLVAGFSKPVAVSTDASTADDTDSAPS